MPRYNAARTKTEKGKVIVDIVEKLRRESPTGVGMVRLNQKTGRWSYIGTEKAKDKIGHALRKASQEQERLKQKKSRKRKKPPGQLSSAPPSRSDIHYSNDPYHDEMTAQGVPSGIGTPPRFESPKFERLKSPASPRDNNPNSKAPSFPNMDSVAWGAEDSPSHMRSEMPFQPTNSPMAYHFSAMGGFTLSPESVFPSNSPLGSARLHEQPEIPRAASVNHASNAPPSKRSVSSTPPPPNFPHNYPSPGSYHHPHIYQPHHPQGGPSPNYAYPPYPPPPPPPPAHMMQYQYPPPPMPIHMYASFHQHHHTYVPPPPSYLPRPRNHQPVPNVSSSYGYNPSFVPAKGVSIDEQDERQERNEVESEERNGNHFPRGDL